MAIVTPGLLEQMMLTRLDAVCSQAWFCTSTTFFSICARTAGVLSIAAACFGVTSRFMPVFMASAIFCGVMLRMAVWATKWISPGPICGASGVGVPCRKRCRAGVSRVRALVSRSMV